MNIQEKLIGKHPASSCFFADWLNFKDPLPSQEIRQRELHENGLIREQAIEKIADWLITHHIPEYRIKELEVKKRILSEYGYKDYFNSYKLLPNNDKTKKGNFCEVLLSEYLTNTTDLELLIFRLRYNPNVDQSMKGDDVLLLKKSNIKEKLILGECKFRKYSSRDVIEEILKEMGASEKSPLSLSFVQNILWEQGKKKLAREVAKLQTLIPKGKTELINVGFILSNHLIHNHVQNYGSSFNQKLVFISLGIDDPENFINQCFAKANKKLDDIKACPLHKFPSEFAGEYFNVKAKEFVESLKTLIP